MEEIATLKALGARGATLQNVFVFEGFLIGAIGGGLGILIGLGVALNIDRVFRLIEGLFNLWILPSVEWTMRPFVPDVFIPRVSIFSPAVFYIEKVPAEVYFPEALFIMAFAVLCSLLAAYFASKRVTEADPAEIMRNQ
jgi:lipoprotein-releasing system permease protein